MFRLAGLPEPEDPEGDHPQRITSAMLTLAHTVLHGSWSDRRDAARALAALILEAAE